MNNDFKILNILRNEYPDLYQTLYNRVTEKPANENKPTKKTYKTNFVKKSPYTTKKILQEFEDMGLDALIDLFDERCNAYSNDTKRCMPWLYIPEIMHVIASLHYDAPNSQKVDLQKMKTKWNEAKKSKNKTKNQDNFIADE